MRRELATYADLLRDVLAAADAVHYPVPGAGESDLDQSLALERADMAEERAIDRLAKGVHAHSLWRLVPGLEALHARLLDEGRQDATTGLSLGNGAVAFAVPVLAEGVRMVAVEDGRHRFATAIVPGEDDGFSVVVGHYLPDAAAFLASLPSPLPDDTKAVVDLAERRRRYANEFSPGLAQLAEEVAKRGRMPYRGDCFALQVRRVPDGRIDTYIAVDNVWVGHWNSYARMMAPVAVLAPPPSFAWCTTSHDSALAEAALALDDGYCGQHCLALDAAVRERLLVRRARATAHKFAVVHATLVKHGYVWGKKRLRFGDLDEAAFAVPTALPGLDAFVREHGSARTLVTLQRGADGVVERIAALPLYRSQAWLMESWYKPSVDCLNNLARLVGGAANPTANPPRLTQGDAARALAAGAPLPPPSIAIDLVDGRPSPSATTDAHVGTYLFFETDLAYRALADLVPGAKTIYGCHAETFRDDDDDAEPAPDPDSLLRNGSGQRR